MTSSTVRVDLDLSADAAYIGLSEEPVVRTVSLTDEVMVDLDEMGVVVGVEVLSLSAEIPFSRLECECHVHSDVIDVIRTIRPDVGTFVAQIATVPERSTATDSSLRQQPLTPA